MSSGRRDALVHQPAGGQLEVVPGRPHRHRDPLGRAAGRGHPDLQGLLGRDPVLVVQPSAVAELAHAGAHGRPGASGLHRGHATDSRRTTRRGRDPGPGDYRGPMPEPGRVALRHIPMKYSVALACLLAAAVLTGCGDTDANGSKTSRSSRGARVGPGRQGRDLRRRLLGRDVGEAAGEGGRGRRRHPRGGQGHPTRRPVPQHRLRRGRVRLPRRPGPDGRPSGRLGQRGERARSEGTGGRGRSRSTRAAASSCGSTRATAASWSS